LGLNRVEPEEAVLGCVLLDNSIIDNLTLTPNDFESNKTRSLYQTMQEMRSKGTPIDIITLAKKFPGREQDITELMSAVPTSAAVDFYADQVAEDATKRRII